MKNKKRIFLIYAIAILFVPLYVIVNSQNILSNGTFYKFRPQAYDPVDPLRGNYLRINYNVGSVPTNDDFEERDEVYVSIGVDKEGFAFFEEAFKNPPKKGDYLISKVRYVSGLEEVRTGIFGRRSNAISPNDRGNYKTTVSIDIPDNLTKYFINEDYGLAGEKAFRKERESAYIGVRVKSGQCRIQDIYIKDMPIMEYLKK